MLPSIALRHNSVDLAPDSHRFAAASADANVLGSALRALGVVVCLVAVMLSTRVSPAAETLSKPDTSRAARNDAAASVPIDKIAPQMRPRVQNVVNNPSIFRRLPVERIECDADLYYFLIRNPEVVVNIWQIMGITGMTLDRVGPDRFRAADGQGTTGVAEYVYRTPEMLVIYAEGTYEGPMAPGKLRGQCVLVMKFSYGQLASGKAVVTSRLDAFLHLDNIGVEWIARSLQPLVGKTADRNFGEASSFVQTMSHTAETNPVGVARLSQKLTRIDAATRQRLIEISAQASERATSAENAYAEATARRAMSTDAAARVQRADAISQPR